MTAQEITAALVDALNSSTRLPALWPIARIKYPGRECQPRQLPNGTWNVSLALRGYEYKSRQRRPQSLPPLDLTGIQQALTAALPTNYAVLTIEYQGGGKILLMIGEIKI